MDPLHLPSCSCLVCVHIHICQQIAHSLRQQHILSNKQWGYWFSAAYFPPNTYHGQNVLLLSKKINNVNQNLDAWFVNLLLNVDINIGIGVVWVPQWPRVRICPCFPKPRKGQKNGPCYALNPQNLQHLMTYWLILLIDYGWRTTLLFFLIYPMKWRLQPCRRHLAEKRRIIVSSGWRYEREGFTRCHTLHRF